MKKNFTEAAKQIQWENFLCSLSCKSKEFDPEEGRSSFVDFKT